MRQFRQTLSWVAALVVTAAVLAPGSASAATIVFTTGPGDTDSAGEPVSASAAFTTGTNTVTIDLRNLIVNQKSIGQNVSDLFFTLSNTSLQSGTTTSGTAISRNVASDGSFTDGGTVDAGWALTFNSTTGFHLNGLAGATFTPAHTLIGLPDPVTNTYDNANNSITGNGPHNPFLAPPVTFVLNIAGVTSATSITSATFSFGTTAGDNVRGVPEPTTTALGLSGFITVGLATLRRRLRRSREPQA